MIKKYQVFKVEDKTLTFIDIMEGIGTIAVLSKVLKITPDKVMDDWTHCEPNQAEYVLKIHPENITKSEWHFRRRSIVLLRKLQMAEDILKSIHQTGCKIWNETITDPIEEYFENE